MLYEVVVIGNFDGVHRGHQMLLQKGLSLATTDKAPVVYTFDPHPKRLLTPHVPPFQLSHLATKCQLLRTYGAKDIIIEPFTPDFAARSALEFIQSVIIDKLQTPKYIIVGANFCFGKHRSGDIALLKTLGEQYHFNVVACPMLKDETFDCVVSSTTIRQAIQAGNMRQANQLLGHPWIVEMQVVTGQKLARSLGFPTANGYLDDYVQPKFGVYLVKATAPELNRSSYGIANYGVKPTLETTATKPLLEIHLFDIHETLYDKTLYIEFLAFIRPEIKFKDLTELQQHIKRDMIAAKQKIKNFKEFN